MEMGRRESWLEPKGCPEGFDGTIQIALLSKREP
jgi:hypothetical protein